MEPELFSDIETVSESAYRCEECKSLVELEPTPLVVNEWDSASQKWIGRVMRVCVACRSRLKSAYRRNEGGFGR
jgi:dUTPase